MILRGGGGGGGGGGGEGLRFLHLGGYVENEDPGQFH